MSLGSKQKLRFHVYVEGGLLHASLRVPIRLVRHTVKWTTLIVIVSIVLASSPDVIPRMAQLMPYLFDALNKLAQ